MSFLRRFLKKKPNIKKYDNIKFINYDNIDNKKLKNYQLSVRSNINNLNNKYGKKGFMGDRLNQNQIDEVVKSIIEKKLKRLKNGNSENLKFNVEDINNISNDFNSLKKRNLNERKKKVLEWTIKITAVGIAIWRGLLILTEIENQEKMLKELEEQKKNINKEKENSNDKDKSFYDKQLEELNKLKGQADILGSAIDNLNDEELKIYLSLSPENRIKYLIDLGLISINDDGSLKLINHNWIIYLIIGILVIIIITILILLL